MAGQWVSFMQRAESLNSLGAPVFALRYEELTSAPQQAFAAVFDHCGLSPVDGRTLEQVLAEDSQDGSDISRSAVQEAVGDRAEHGLGDGDVTELRRAIAELSPDVKPDHILPGSFGFS